MSRGDLVLQAVRRPEENPPREADERRPPTPMRTLGFHPGCGGGGGQGVGKSRRPNLAAELRTGFGVCVGQGGSGETREATADPGRGAVQRGGDCGQLSLRDRARRAGASSLGMQLSAIFRMLVWNVHGAGPRTDQEFPPWRLGGGMGSEGGRDDARP